MDPTNSVERLVTGLAADSPAAAAALKDGLAAGCPTAANALLAALAADSPAAAKVLFDAYYAQTAANVRQRVAARYRPVLDASGIAVEALNSLINLLKKMPNVSAPGPVELRKLLYAITLRKLCDHIRSCDALKRGGAATMSPDLDMAQLPRASKWPEAGEELIADDLKTHLLQGFDARTCEIVELVLRGEEQLVIAAKFKINAVTVRRIWTKFADRAKKYLERLEAGDTPVAE